MQIRNMFELSKNILQKVSFDKTLFQKELTKALQWLKKEEQFLLFVWCVTTFHQYKDLVIEVYRNVTKS